MKLIGNINGIESIECVNNLDMTQNGVNIGTNYPPTYRVNRIKLISDSINSLSGVIKYNGDNNSLPNYSINDLYPNCMNEFDIKQFNINDTMI